MIGRLGLAAGVVACSLMAGPGAAFAQSLAQPLWQYAEPGAAEGTPDRLLHLAKSYGPSGTNGSSAPAAEGELSESESGSIGCIIGGIIGTAAAAYVGGPNIVNLIAGGVVPASSPGAFYVALGGVVFASFCAVGQAITPVVMLAYRTANDAMYGDQPEAAPPATTPNNPPALLGRLIKFSAQR